MQQPATMRVGSYEMIGERERREEERERRERTEMKIAKKRSPTPQQKPEKRKRERGWAWEATTKGVSRSTREEGCSVIVRPGVCGELKKEESAAQTCENAKNGEPRCNLFTVGAVAPAASAVCPPSVFLCSLFVESWVQKGCVAVLAVIVWGGVARKEGAAKNHVRRPRTSPNALCCVLARWRSFPPLHTPFLSSASLESALHISGLQWQWLYACARTHRKGQKRREQKRVVRICYHWRHQKWLWLIGAEIDISCIPSCATTASSTLIASFWHYASITEQAWGCAVCVVQPRGRTDNLCSEPFPTATFIRRSRKNVVLSLSGQKS
jgi:hypothetical protein